MHHFLLEMLQCPACQGELEWKLFEQEGDRIEVGEAHCQNCREIYLVREGIGIFLTSDLPRDDLWEKSHSQLSQMLQSQPEIEQSLMGVPVESLSPADQFYRALVLEERGDFARAQAIVEAATARIYTPEYQVCQESQAQYLSDYLAASTNPIVDLASGRAPLAQELTRHTQNPIVITDFSLRQMRQNRRRLAYFNLYERISLLAFDARRTPFKDGAVKLMTTNLGLPNILEPGNLLKELRRVVSGELLAISIFYPEDDHANRVVIDQLGLSTFLYRLQAHRNFFAAGWNLRVANQCLGRAAPTPKGVVLEGAEIDRLPAVETILEWCTLHAT